VPRLLNLQPIICVLSDLPVFGLRCFDCDPRETRVVGVLWVNGNTFIVLNDVTIFKCNSFILASSSPFFEEPDRYQPGACTDCSPWIRSLKYLQLIQFKMNGSTINS